MNRDGWVSPLDGLLVINQLNGERHTLVASGSQRFHLDVNEDQVLSPIDALLIVNHLNQRVATEGEETAGTAEVQANPGSGEVPTRVASTRSYVAGQDDGSVSRYAVATSFPSGATVGAGTYQFAGGDASPEASADPPPQTPAGDSQVGENGAVVFTGAEDFAVGDLFNVRVDADADLVQLSPPSEITTLPFIWIPNLNGSLSKIDIQTGDEVARYWTAPAHVAGGASPSRTTVGLDGSCALGNREIGTVVIFGNENWTDRNGNGILDTSTDANGDGNISPDEMLPFGQDEKLLYEIVVLTGKEGVYVPGLNGQYYGGGYSGTSGARGIAFDQDGRLWIGGRDSQWYHVFDPESEQIIDSRYVGDLAAFTQFNGTPAAGDHQPYGAVVDKNGYLWSASLQGSPPSLLRINTRDLNDVKVLIPGHQVYGMGLDTEGNLVVNGWQSRQLMKVNVETGDIIFDVYRDELFEGRGVAVTPDGNIWAVSTNRNHVVRYDSDGNHQATISGFSGPTGVAVDAQGNVWVCDVSSDRIYRIDPATNTVDLSKPIVDSGNHYTYSDMTGQVLYSQFNPGTWTEVVDGGRQGMPWGTVSWEATIPDGSAIEVWVRSADARQELDSQKWNRVQSDERLVTMRGQYLQVQARFRSQAETALPQLHSLHVASVSSPAISISHPLTETQYESGQTILVSGQALAAVHAGPNATTLPNRVVAVLINGVAVDAVDGSGNFYHQTTVLPGENLLQVTAIDALGQRSSRTISLFGAADGDGGFENLLFDVSPSFREAYARTSFDDRTNLLYAQMAIKNIGQYGVVNPFLVGVRNISDPTVSVVHEAGRTREGMPYYDFSALVPGSSLDATEITGLVDATFHNPGQVRFTYELVFLAKLNEPPIFTSIPVMNAYLGQPYEYDADAIDAESDTLEYSLVNAPRGMMINHATGEMTWTATEADLGAHQIMIRVDDGREGAAEQHYVVHVTEAPPNRPPMITSVPVIEATVAAVVDEVPQLVDLSSWQTVQYELNFQPDANWDVASTGTSVVQRVNSDASFFMSDFESAGERIEGTWRVETTGDDDFIGIVFGYQDRGHFYLFDWKQANQNHRGYAERGMSVKVFHADQDPIDYDFWPTAGSDNVDVLYHNTIAWQDNVEYRFALDFQPGQFTITVSDEASGVVLDTIELFDNTYTSGKFGFYNYSQDSVRYEGFTRQVIAGYTYHYDVEATDPDLDAVHFDLTASPPGMRINPNTGLIAWAPTADLLGSHSVTVEAKDADGARDSQTFSVEVLPDPSNHAPVIVSEPVTQLAADEYLPGSQNDLTFTVPGVPGESVEATFTWTIRRAAYNNEFGIYRVSDADGLVGDYLPGQPEYAPAALSPDNALVVFHSGQGAGAETAVTLTAGETYGFFIIQNSTLDTLRANNPNNNITGGPLAFFSFPQANPDNQFDHLHSVVQPDGRTEFFWEDLTYGGDQSFMDVVFVIDMSLLPGAPKTYRYEAVAVDPDQDDLTFSLESAPPNASIDAETGVVSWLAASGTFDFTVSVADGRGGSDRQSFTVVVDEGGTAVIRGMKFDDLDADGVRDGANPPGTDPLEPGVPNWIIYLDQNRNGRLDTGERWTLTDDNGDYTFAGLPAGSYRVAEDLQPGWLQTFPGTHVHTLELVDDEIASQIDFGNHIVDAAGNLPPSFVSDPPSAAMANQLLKYDSLAIDPNGDAITYQLIVRPEGMTVHPDLGVIVWQPTNNQTGRHRIVLKASDGHGGNDVQSFVLDVAAPNAAPIITTESLPAQIQADLPLALFITAQDVENDPLRFSLSSTVPGVPQPGIDEQTGRLDWLPDLSQLGTWEITVTVNDGHTAATSKTYSVEVVEILPNDPPVIRSIPRTTTRIDMPLHYVVEASDPNGDPLTFALNDDAPSEMMVDQQGVLSWTPSSSALGSHAISLIVSDGRGGEAVQDFTLRVVSDAVNTAPRIVSNPELTALLGSSYTYRPVARDAEGDHVIWRLDAAPRGMSIAATTGQLFWTPETDQRGIDNQVVLRVTDMFGASSTQSFGIAVRGQNLPPLVLSSPITEAFVDEMYVYAVQAQDPDGDRLEFELVENLYPEGMIIDPDTGLIQWTPNSQQMNANAVSVLVRDSFGGIDLQAFSIEVTDANLNLAPTITSTPRYSVTAGHEYVYSVQAVDPEVDSVTFSLEGDNLPTELAITPDGTITWSPSEADLGTYVLTVVATDTALNRATQTYTLVVRENQAPTIVSAGRANGVAGLQYSYDISATDPESDPLSYVLTQAPSGMAVDNQGRVRWLPDRDLMNQTVRCGGHRYRCVWR